MKLLKTGLMVAAGLTAFSLPAYSYTYIAYGKNVDAKDCYQAAMMAAPSRYAFESCDRALKNEMVTAEQRAGILVNRGILKFESDDFNGAYEDYNAAIKLHPGLAEAYANRGTVLFIAERYDEALSDYNTALELNPEDELPVRLNRAMVLYAVGQPEAAEADYLRVLEISENPDGAREKMRAFKAEFRAQ